MTPYVFVAGLTLLAGVLVFIGFRFGHRSGNPKLFRIGSITAAAGLMLLWVSLAWVLSADRGVWAMPLFVAALFVPLSLLGLGLQLMARASGSRDETAFDRSFEDFVRHNDLP